MARQTNFKDLKFSVIDVSKFIVFSFLLGGIYWQIKQSNDLADKIACSLNKTNKQLLIRGIIDDADFVSRDHVDTTYKAEYVFAPICSKKNDDEDETRRRMSLIKETAFDDNDFETKQTE